VAFPSIPPYSAAFRGPPPYSGTAFHRQCPVGNALRGVPLSRDVLSVPHMAERHGGRSLQSRRRFRADETAPRTAQ